MEAVSPKPDLKPVKPQPMVGWYNPRQLAKTAREVLISTIVGKHADQRLMEALADRTPESSEYFDYTKDDLDVERNEVGVDFIADVGDGWNSTYATAYYLSQPVLEVTDPAGKKHTTKRAEVLILGGDQVYPTASREEYELRLVAPYETALAQTQPPHPHLFALPGNHDWYDSLVSFTRLFVAKKWFAGWQVPQRRSYFALKLPHRWWLVGTDVQLGSDLDQPQVDYFSRIAKEMEPGDRIILCNAEPHWVLAKEKMDNANSNLAFLENKVFEGKRIALYLAGDLHHYRRHARDDGWQKITAGGGGAFLHPTHGLSDQPLEDGYELKAAYPDQRTSRKLGWRNLLFPFKNPGFGPLIGTAYVLTGWSAMVNLSSFALADWFEAVKYTLTIALGSPVAAFWGVALFAGFWLFTDTESRAYRFLGGSLHGLSHVVLVFVLGWAITDLSVNHWGMTFKQLPHLFTSALLMFAGGWLCGSLLMGIYLLVSLNVFGYHKNEAFSSLGVEDYKHFLRMKIGTDGALTLYPVAIDRVPRKWKNVAADFTEARMAPDDPRATPPRLIEQPVPVGAEANKFTAT